MKNTKKIFSALLLAALIILAVGVTAFAEDGAADVQDAETNGFFEAVYSFLEAHASELLSALAFVSSIAVALCYKRGMLPALSGAVGSIGRAIGTLGEKTDNGINAISAAASNMLEQLGLTRESLAGAALRLDELSARLTATEQTQSELNNLRTVMAVQIDVLYDIFMASSLPQYRKDIIGEKVAKMKNCLEVVTDEGAAS